MPAIFSAKLAEKVLGLLMDVLNDDSVVVRLGALETMHHIAVSGHLKVQEMHMHMVNFCMVDGENSEKEKKDGPMEDDDDDYSTFITDVSS
ncbi:hypothetical protein E3N88_33564 [Mikania micrantha]|nr:hypothetical protein E3N88_33564 [Mikania micrantha]